MPGGTFYIKQNDRLPAIQATLVDGNGNPVNLTGATVTFFMANQSGTLIVNGGSCTTVNATGGVVSYSWGVSDTATAGTYNAQFDVSIGGLKQTFPSDGNIIVSITASLG